jgi:hypothetical protein
MRVGGRSDMMIALSLGRCKPFLMMPSCDCRVSVATGTSKLQVQSLPLYPESDGQSSKCGLSRSASSGLMHCKKLSPISEVTGSLPES